MLAHVPNDFYSNCSLPLASPLPAQDWADAIAKKQKDAQQWRETLASSSSTAAASSTSSTAAASSSTAKAPGKDRTYLPSTLSLEEAKKFMPPTGQLAHVPDTAAGRLRCYYGKGTERISQGASLEGRTLRQAAIPLFKWAWGLHKGATGKLCPYVFD